MNIETEVCQITAPFWNIKLIINGNETWILDRAFESKKQAETHAEKWTRKWSKRLWPK